MNLQTLLAPIADFLVWIFINVFEILGNIPNFIFIVVGIAGMIYWLMLQKKFNKQAEQNGTLK